MRAIERVAPQRRRRAPPQRSIPFARYARKGGPAFADIFPREDFAELLDRTIGGVVGERGRVGLVTLRRVFGLDDAQVAKLLSAVSDAVAANPGRRLDLSRALAPFRAALLAKYDQVPQAVGWWIVTDPGRQYTASLDPRMEDPASWYGDAFEADAKTPTPDDFVEALLATLEMRQLGPGDHAPVFDGMCPLCHDPLFRGAPNSVILPCGHIYHWAENEEGCSGLYSWVMRDNGNCPTCRRRFEVESDSEDDFGLVPVIVEW